MIDKILAECLADATAVWFDAGDREPSIYNYQPIATLAAVLYAQRMIVETRKDEAKLREIFGEPPTVSVPSVWDPDMKPQETDTTSTGAAPRMNTPDGQHWWNKETKQWVLVEKERFETAGQHG